MKKLWPLLVLAFVFNLSAQSQSKVFNALRLCISQQHPEIDFSEKIIAFNVWQIDDKESRDKNKQFEKAMSVYRDAKLKGGRKGLLVVLVNTSNYASDATIVLHKDGITVCLISDESFNADFLSYPSKNGLFDVSGNIIAENLSTDSIYPTVQSLITR